MAPGSEVVFCIHDNRQGWVFINVNTIIYCCDCNRVISILCDLKFVMS
jgi:hypothetical protein